MQTMFNVDETVLLVAKITDIKIDKKGVHYRIIFRDSNGNCYTTSVKEEELRKEII